MNLSLIKLQVRIQTEIEINDRKTRNNPDLTHSFNIQIVPRVNNHKVVPGIIIITKALKFFESK